MKSEWQRLLAAPPAILKLFFGGFTGPATTRVNDHFAGALPVVVNRNSPQRSIQGTVGVGVRTQLSKENS